jgi:cytochrome d ubiquinol oxidase subunit I
VPERVHLAAIWLVAIGSNLSALWILLANGWMQHPVGYAINPATGRPELNDFLALVANPKGWIFFWHTISAGFATASFVIVGISAYHIARQRDLGVFRKSFHMGALVGLVAGALVFLGGHTQGQYVYRTQPMKMAAIEALWTTEKPASFSILTIGDLSGRREIWSLRIPALTSLLACNNFSCQVQGVDDLQAQYVQEYGPGEYIPLIVVTYWGFRIMMTAGLLIIAFSAFFLWSLGHNLEQARWLRWVPWVIVLPYIANISGWILTEMGRQPWIVQGLLKVQDAVSPNLTNADVLASLIGFALLYGALAAADVHLMRKYAVAGPEAAMTDSVDLAPAPIGSQD